MINKKQALVGVWQTEERDSNAVFEIELRGNRFHVHAYNKRDGEQYVVSDVKWRRGGLKFETYVKSTKHRARHFLKPQTRRRFVQEITLFETWTKVDGPIE